MYGLQTLQTINAIIYSIALIAWMFAAYRRPKLRGFIFAPVFYCLLVVVFYLSVFLFSTTPDIDATIFTVASSFIRACGGLLLAGIAVIIQTDHRGLE